MKLTRILLSLTGALCVTAAQAAYDGTITFGNRPAGYGTGPGGAFELTVTGGLSDLVTGAGGKFLSFCIEHDETIIIPGGYNANINSQAIDGGVGGPSPDPISLATAWLYSYFRSGALASYGYVYGNNASANALQDA